MSLGQIKALQHVKNWGIYDYLFTGHLICYRFFIDQDSRWADEYMSRMAGEQMSRIAGWQVSRWANEQDSRWLSEHLLSSPLLRSQLSKGGRLLLLAPLFCSLFQFLPLLQSYSQMLPWPKFWPNLGPFDDNWQWSIASSTDMIRKNCLKEAIL